MDGLVKKAEKGKEKILKIGGKKVNIGFYINF